MAPEAYRLVARRVRPFARRARRAHRVLVVAGRRENGEVRQERLWSPNCGKGGKLQPVMSSDDRGAPLEARSVDG
jgi:hypothetical protein